ncbi:MAG: GGDEF domain-containing protein [Lachnospiraceae bacterium]|nr:GGDEF domain-containing protein [Lachnospiraceae bacterium]
MKKRIAIFANGWSNEYLRHVIEGIKKRASDCHADLYLFVNYSSGSDDRPYNLAAKAIFELPDFRMFDGVILLTNIIHCSTERTYLINQIRKHHIPSVSLEYELEGMPCLYTDTSAGIYMLTSHLITKHNAKHIVYVSGPKDHQENLQRLQAVCDALAEIGRQLTSEDILYGNWSYYEAYNATLQWLSTHEQLPDAFVCANDEMAIAVCSALSKIGKRIPEDTLVTGCDCIESGQQIYPILSTISRDWDKLGYDALDCVLRQINGEVITGVTEYSSTPVFGESCGCTPDETILENRRQALTDSYCKQRESVMREWHLRRIDDMLKNISNTPALKDCMSYNFSDNHSYEGDTFLICLIDDFIHSKSIGKYPQKMEVYTHLENGQVKPCVSFRSKDLLPPLTLDEEASNFFLFAPLHVEEEINGYVVFINKQEMLYNQTLPTWAGHLSLNLNKVRQNIHLEELNQRLIEVSMTDFLTGLKNRTGYDALAFPFLQRCQKEGKLSAMIFADINRMKLINDKYGHLQGDLAICTVAEAIKRTMPPNWIAVRFGGDEFIMVGACENESDADELKLLLAQNLEEIKTERKLQFPLTASFGAVVINPQEHYSLEEYLRKADEAMYVMKQKAHNEEQKY